MSRNPRVIPEGKSVEFTLVSGDNGQHATPATATVLTQEADAATIQRFVDSVDAPFLGALMSAVTARLRRE